MPHPNLPEPQISYDPRWFIWTIVFLVVTGVSLVTYITVSDAEENSVSSEIVTHRTRK